MVIDGLGKAIAPLIVVVDPLVAPNCVQPLDRLDDPPVILMPILNVGLLPALVINAGLVLITDNAPVPRNRQVVEIQSWPALVKVAQRPPR